MDLIMTTLKLSLAVVLAMIGFALQAQAQNANSNPPSTNPTTQPVRPKPKPADLSSPNAAAESLRYALSIGDVDGVRACFVAETKAERDLLSALNDLMLRAGAYDEAVQSLYNVRSASLETILPMPTSAELEPVVKDNSATVELDKFTTWKLRRVGDKWKVQVTSVLATNDAELSIALAEGVAKALRLTTASMRNNDFTSAEAAGDALRSRLASVMSQLSERMVRSADN